MRIEAAAAVLVTDLKEWDTHEFSGLDNSNSFQAD
jgi:hypothetical protein